MTTDDFRKLVNKARKIYAYTAGHGCVEVTRKAAVAWAEMKTGDVKRCHQTMNNLWIGSNTTGEEITP